MALSNPNYLPKISSPKPLHGKLSIQHILLEETQFSAWNAKSKVYLKIYKNYKI